MRIRALILLGALTTAAISARAEDMQLRDRAVQLLNIARAVNTIHGGAFTIATEATFSATADDGSLRTGSYSRLRIPAGSLRQEIRFGDWQATNIFVDRSISIVGPWNFPPFAVRELLNLVPHYVGFFDQQDVVRAIRDGSAAGQQATCIDYDTIHGEKHSSNVACVSKADGNLLTMREEDRSYEWSKYATVAGAAYPQHIEFHLGTSFSLSIDLTMTRLDSAPEGAFAIPTGAQTGTLCKSFTSPVALRSPQPEAKGGPDAPVTDVVLQISINADGTVGQSGVSHPVRPDLDAEALKLVQTWTFQPATCNGQPNPVPGNVVLHFQGR